MAELNIIVDVYCPNCDSCDIAITDADENTYFCFCRRCKKRFEKMRT